MDWRWRSWNANPRSSESSNSIYHQIFNRGRHNNTANNNRSASHKKVLIQTADYNHHEYAIELLPWKYDWPARIKSFSKTQCCFPLVLCMFCLFHVFILLKCWHLAENMLLFPKVPLILWIGYKQSTRCGRVHFEHSHRKWLVITVRPTTSVRESPRKNLPPRNTPDLFCRRFTRQNHRCAAWAVFFFFTNKILCSCSIFQNSFFCCCLYNFKVLFLCLKEVGRSVRTAPGFLHTVPWILHKPSERDTVPWPHTFCGRAGQRRCTNRGRNFVQVKRRPHYMSRITSTYFLRLNNSETITQKRFWAQR